jgi:hypothetical protein
MGDVVALQSKVAARASLPMLFLLRRSFTQQSSRSCIPPNALSFLLRRN